MKLAAGFLLIVGCLWTLFTVWLFLTIAGIASPPESWPRVALYFGGLLAGPLILVVGAAVLLWGESLRRGAILIGLGCAILTGFILYNSIAGMQPQPLQAPPPYSFYMVLLLVMVASDAAAFKIYKSLREHSES